VRSARACARRASCSSRVIRPRASAFCSAALLRCVRAAEQSRGGTATALWSDGCVASRELAGGTSAEGGGGGEKMWWASAESRSERFLPGSGHPQ
jgi:hypothetical protein